MNSIFRALRIMTPGPRPLSLNTMCRNSCTSTPVVEDTIGEISYLDIRVGKVLAVTDHPSDPNLYIKKIQVADNVGEERTIVAGIRSYCTKEELLDSFVIVLCNLKPRTIRGVDSTGMVLCCSDGAKTKVQPVRPPAGCAPGTSITFPGFKSLVSPEAMAANSDLPSISFNRINKAFSKVAPYLQVNADGVAVFKVSTAPPTGKKAPATADVDQQFKTVKFCTPQGPCTGPIPDSTIS